MNNAMTLSATVGVPGLVGCGPQAPQPAVKLPGAGLSLAVIHRAGPVTDRIDGTSQAIDHVRIWQSPDHSRK